MGPNRGRQDPDGPHVGLMNPAIRVCTSVDQAGCTGGCRSDNSKSLQWRHNGCDSVSNHVVYAIVYSDADQRKHQSSASLAFVRGIHRGPVNSPHKWPVTRKMLPFDDVIMFNQQSTVKAGDLPTSYPCLNGIYVENTIFKSIHV